MERFCPECMGTLQFSTDDKVRCTIHGGEYRVLFNRASSPAAREMKMMTPTVAKPPSKPTADFTIVCPNCGKEFKAHPEHVGRYAQCTECQTGFPILPPQPPRPQPAAAAVCAAHPTMSVVGSCGDCGKPLCATCAFTQPDGSVRCADCVQPRATGAPPAGVMCVVHRAMPAVCSCSSCGAGICATCDFAFAGGMHLCPTCATSAPKKLSSRRKTLVGWAYVMAAWSTLALPLLSMAGSNIRSRSDQEAYGVVFMLLVFVPTLVGTALAVAARDRHLANPPSMTAALVWNAIILALLMVLILVGLFSS